MITGETKPIGDMGTRASALLAAGELLDAGVLTTDGDLVVTGWNAWLAAVSGRTGEQVVGRSLLELYPELAGTSCEVAFRRALIGETVVRSHRFHEFLIPFPAGPAFPEFARMQQSARVTPLVTNGVVTGTIAIIEDVSERVAREIELRRAVEQAQSASKAKSEFIASMSHELRTPLSAIIGYADILITEIAGPMPIGQKEHVQRVKVGAWHLMGIIEEILTFSRAEAGREESHPEPVNPAKICEEALALVAPQAGQKGLTVKLAIDPIPEVLETDRGKLRQILVNLLGNAVKFTDVGEVELHAFLDGEMLCFAIRDSGPGIASAELERIFEPFTQVDYSLTRIKGGTGLGLAVSQRLAAILGGSLAVESVVGVGSKFTLSLPMGAMSASS